MTLRFFLIWGMKLLLVLSLADSKAQAQFPLRSNPEVDAALRVLDLWIAARVAEVEQPGLSIGIVYDQDLLWSKGYGYADLAERVPATATTLYRIASITKLFTATAVVQLRDQGKLRLDDPVSDHLPWFRLRTDRSIPIPITIRHLLSHTSGLPREAAGLNWTDLNFPVRESLIDGLAEQVPVFAPDSRLKYSNLAFSIAGELVSRLSNQEWAQYIDERLLNPLGMTGTVAVPTADTPGLATGYGRRSSGRPRSIEPFVDIAGENPAGSMASNVEDLARFISLQFRDRPDGDGQVLGGSSLREMHRVQWLRPDWSGGWAIGFSVRRVDNDTRLNHGGALPGHRAQLEFSPQQKLGVVVLTNANDGNPGRFVNQAFNIVGPAIASAVTLVTPRRLPDLAWKQYVGTYVSRDAEIEVMVAGGNLVMISPDVDDPWGSRILLRPDGGHTFRAEPAGWSTGLNGERLFFEIDNEGKVTRLVAPNWYWTRKQ